MSFADRDILRLNDSTASTLYHIQCRNPLGYVPTSRQDELARKWEDIEDDLGRDEFRNLFAHLYVVYLTRTGDHRELAEAFRRDVLAEREITSGMPFIDKV